MRSPWVSPILGFVMWQGSGLYLLLLMRAVVASSFGEALSANATAYQVSWPIAATLGLCGVALAILGLILAVRHLRAGTKPRWASIVGLVLGLINVWQWPGLLFVAPRLIELSKSPGF